MTLPVNYHLNIVSLLSGLHFLCVYLLEFECISVSEWMKTDKSVYDFVRSRKIHMPDFIYIEYYTIWLITWHSIHNTQRYIYMKTAFVSFVSAVPHMHDTHCMHCVYYSFILFSFNSAALLFHVFFLLFSIIISTTYIWNWLVNVGNNIIFLYILFHFVSCTFFSTSNDREKVEQSKSGMRLVRVRACGIISSCWLKNECGLRH